MPQRIVVIVALGAASLAVGSYLAGLGDAVSFGCYAYAPLSSAGAGLPGSGLPGLARLLIWLVLVVCWALVSIRILRPSRPRPPAG